MPDINNSLSTYLMYKLFDKAEDCIRQGADINFEIDYYLLGKMSLLDMMLEGANFEGLDFLLKHGAEIKPHFFEVADRMIAKFKGRPELARKYQEVVSNIKQKQLDDVVDNTSENQQIITL